jgi:hypothetical protein
MVAAGADAANLDGHMQYRIVSYSFSNNNGDNAERSVNLGPLLITGNSADIFTGSSYTTPELSVADPSRATDVLAVSADFLATPSLSLQGTFGIAQNRRGASFDSDYDTSWEANVGVIYKLFSNIRYEIHFGYMDTGDLFKERNTYSDVESIIMISNKLTMSF